MINESRKKGYSLVEIVVAVAIFSVISLAATSALLSMVSANKRAEGLRQVVQSVDFALSDILRNARKGYSYHCGFVDTDLSFQVSLGNSGIGRNRNCAGGDYLAFEKADGDSSIYTDQVIYRKNSGAIEKSSDGGSSWNSLTDPSVSIEALEFYVTGSSGTDEEQSKIFVITKTKSAGASSAVPFNVQMTITQRATDL